MQVRIRVEGMPVIFRPNPRVCEEPVRDDYTSRKQRTCAIHMHLHAQMVLGMVVVQLLLSVLRVVVLVCWGTCSLTGGHSCMAVVF